MIVRYPAKSTKVLLLISALWTMAFSANQNLLIPHIANSGGWETFLSINNAGTSSGEVTVVLYENGTQIERIVETVSAKEQKQVQLTRGTCGHITLNGQEIHVQESYIHSIDGGIAAFHLTGLASPQLHFLLPQYHSENLTWSGIAFHNASLVEANIGLTAYNPNGEIIGGILSSRGSIIPDYRHFNGFLSGS